MGSPSDAIFKYEPLEHSGSVSFLVLELAEDITADLRAFFHHVRMGDTHEATYEAISYV